MKHPVKEGRSGLDKASNAGAVVFLKMRKRYMQTRL